MTLKQGNRHRRKISGLFRSSSKRQTDATCETRRSTRQLARLEALEPRTLLAGDVTDALSDVIEVGDFNRNGQLDAEDIELISEAIRNQDLGNFDLNQDGKITSRDRTFWINELARTYIGDSNLDGLFDSSDLVSVFQQGQYEDQISQNSSWSSGDWNGDFEFGSTDFVVAFQAGGYEQGPNTPQIEFINISAETDSPPRGDFITTFPAIDLVGKASPFSTIELTNSEISIVANIHGDFNLADIPLDVGENPLRFCITDIRGNSSIEELTVTRIDDTSITNHWTGESDSNFHNPANWSRGEIPDAFSNVVFDLPGRHTINIGQEVIVESLTIGAGTGKQTVSLSGARVNVNSTVRIREDAKIYLSAGSILDVGGDLFFDGTVVSEVTDSSIGQVRTAGTAFLNGSLNLRMEGHYRPLPGERFQVMTHHHQVGNVEVTDPAGIINFELETVDHGLQVVVASFRPALSRYREAKETFTGPKGQLITFDKDPDLVWLANSGANDGYPYLDFVDTPLLTLYSRTLQNPHAAPVGQQRIGGIPFAERFETDGIRPYVEAYVTETQSAVPHLEEIGVEVDFVYDSPDSSIVFGWLPTSAIGTAASVPGLISLRASEFAETNSAGQAENQWEAVTLADQIKRAMPGVDGSGIKIGIISDSVNQVGGGLSDSQGSCKKTDPADCDLPSDHRVPAPIKDGNASHADEGRAMMELIHDIAPQSELLFHTGMSKSDFLRALNEFKSQGVSIVVNDLVYFSQPTYQDGEVAQEIENLLLTDGILFFSSSGNYNQRTFNGVWNDSDGDGFHEFASGSDELIELAPSKNQFKLRLQWNDAWGGADTDIEIHLYNSVGELVASSAQSNTTGNKEPYDSLSHAIAPGDTQQYYVALRHAGGSQPTGQQILFTSPSNSFSDSYMHDNPSIWGFSGSEHVFTIGAENVFAATAADPIEPYSSRGNSTHYFDETGSPLAAPDERDKPDFTASDKVNNSFFGRDVRSDPDTYKNFSGTSAAVTNAGASAALILDAVGGPLSYDEMHRILRVSADGQHAGAFDTPYGYGRINTLGAVLVADGLANGIHELGAADHFVELDPFGKAVLTAAIGNNDDIHTFLFAHDSATDTATLIESSAVSPLDPALLLWDVDAADVIDVDYDSGSIVNAAEIAEHLSPHTLYQAEVVSESDISGMSGDYKVTIIAPPPTVNHLTLGSDGSVSHSETLISPGDTAYFSFTAPLGDTSEMSLRLVPWLWLDPVLTLYDSSGAELERTDVGGAGDVETILSSSVIPGETYFVRVGSSEYGTSGEFDLEIDFNVGIAVTPADVLETSESGAEAQFSVFLDQQPLGDVKIYFVSDDTSEGRVSPVQLDFTPENYRDPQTITVSGVDDEQDDGDVSYSVIVAPAISVDDDGNIVDSFYHGRDSENVSLINLDNDEPPETTPTDGELNEDWWDALINGLKGFADFGSTLSTHELLNNPLPLVTGADGLPLSLAGLVDTGQILKDTIISVAEQYSIDVAPADWTVGGLMSQLETNGNVHEITGGLFQSSTLDELKFEMDFVHEFAIGDLKLDFGTGGAAFGLRPGATLPADLILKLDLDFSFGVDLNPELGSDQAFFVRDVELDLSANIDESSLAFNLGLGLLDMHVIDGLLDLVYDINFGIQNLDGDELGNVSLLEMNGYSLGDLVVVKATNGSLSGTFPVAAEIGDFSFPNSPEMTVSVDPFASTDLDISFNSAFDEILQFGNINAIDVMTMFDQLALWFTQFSSSTSFDIDIPFAKNLSLGSVLDFGRVLEDGLLSSLEELGQPNFQSALALADQLSSVLGVDVDADYREANNLLTYQISMAHDIDSLSSNIDLDYDFGALAELTTESTISVEGSADLTFELGFDLSFDETMTLADRLVIDQASVSGQLDLTIANIAATARFGMVGICIDSGSGNGSISVVADLINPKTGWKRNHFDRTSRRAQHARFAFSATACSHRRRTPFVG